MCGITGFLHFDYNRKADETLLKKMMNTMVHRGPDGEGMFCFNNLALGHRRLSIIDLSTGDQPIYNQNKSICIIYNGEIYNYIELRDELKQLGCRFFTNSDTEVILRAYEIWGRNCQDKLNGMWAFAVWDEKRKELFISRDRMGEKPLYYGVYDNTFVFGSEIKSLLAYGFPSVPNTELTELYLSLGYIPAPYSFYKNVFKLRAGHFLIVKNGAVTESKYWDIPEINEDNMYSDKKKVYDFFSATLHDAVRIRMRSDVSYGAFLSGGLDSSSVVAIMSEISPQPVRTFTIGFSDKQFDERRKARDVSEKFKTKHFEFEVQPDGFDESLNKVLYHYDEPFGDSSAIPTGYVSKIAAQKVKMVLTGDGGDEVLSGYNAYQVEKFAEYYQKIPYFMRNVFPGMLIAFGGLFKGNIRYKINQLTRIFLYANQDYNQRIRMKYSWYIPDLIQEMTCDLGQQISFSDFINDFYKKYNVIDSFYKLMLFHLKILLPDDFLVKVDRMSMAYSLETRIPFLDFRLVEFMVQVSKDMKMQGFERKSILRNTIGKKLPASVLCGPKKGFTVPLREWFRDPYFNTRLYSIYTDDFGLNKKAIKKVVMENKEGRADLGNFIWMLFVLKEWYSRNALNVR